MTNPGAHHRPLRTVIGVDAGGTGTRAVLLDETGRCLSVARTGPGNPTSAGAEVARSNVVGACLQAVMSAPEGVEPPWLVAFTMAGVIAAGGRLPGTDEALMGVGIEARSVFKGDVLSSYFSVTAEPHGSVMIVGTGTTGARIVDGELAEVKDGLGWLLGDEGSGFWIGQRVVQAVCRDLDGRGPSTALTPALMELVDVTSPLQPYLRDQRLLDLQAWAYERRPVQLSVAAALVGQVGEDPLARQIITEAADRLVGTVTAVLSTGDSGVNPGPIVLGGSVVGEQSPVGQELVRRLGERFGGRQILRARDGVAGAALIALRELGVGADAAVLDRITASLEVLRRG